MLFGRPVATLGSSPRAGFSGSCSRRPKVPLRMAPIPDGTRRSGSRLFPNGNAQRISKICRRMPPSCRKHIRQTAQGYFGRNGRDVVAAGRRKGWQRCIESAAPTIDVRFRGLEQSRRRAALAPRQRYPRRAATTPVPSAALPPWSGCPPLPARFPGNVQQTIDNRVPAPCRRTSPPSCFRNAARSVTFPERRTNSSMRRSG